MCIALLTTSHPSYPFILLNNRDEFFNRQTLPADWWAPPNNHVLGGRDLQRQEMGSWLGITKQGRMAVLTNFREPGVEVTKDKSRGGIVNAYLTPSPEQHQSPREFANRLINEVGVHDVGGFTLIFGELQAPKPDGTMPGLSILSNRSASAEDLTTIATKFGETRGLSNSHFGDLSWPKVVEGERLLKEVVARSKSLTQNQLIDELLKVLSVDFLPHRKPEEPWDVYVQQMRKSILIPPVGREARNPKDADSGDRMSALQAASTNGTSTPDDGNVAPESAGYGTQKQTVVLVDHDGKVVFVERTLYDEIGRALGGKDAEKRIEFDVEGWDG